MEDVRALMGQIQILTDLISSHMLSINKKTKEIEAKLEGSKFEHRRTGIVREIEHVAGSYGDVSQLVIFWKDGECKTPSGHYLKSYISLNNLIKCYKRTG